MNQQEMSIRQTTYTPEHYESLKTLMQLCYQDMGAPFASFEEMEILSRLYPQGQLIYLDGDLVIGAMISRLVPYSFYSQPHNSEQATDVSKYESDSAIGDALYCPDIFTHPQYGHLQLGKKLYALLFEVMRIDNIPCLLGTSRLTRYHQYKDRFSVQEYVEQVKAKNIYDPVLCFHMRCGGMPTVIIENFSTDDVLSVGAAVGMTAPNKHYTPNRPINTAPRYNPQGTHEYIAA